MADISQYLQDILDAVYGEQVRGSIHDAIEIINDVSEVVLSTGTAVTGPTSSSTGFYTDSLYLNTNTFELWKCLGTNSWASLGVMKGDPGEPGDNGNRWYNGTAISGKSVNPTVFSGSGITDANANDMYLNTSEGAFYYCVTGGDASTATWSYLFTLSGGGGGADVLSDLQDVSISSIQNGQILQYNTSTSKWENVNPSSGSSTLSGLTDTSISSLQDDQFLRYNSSSSKWENESVTIPSAANNGQLTIQKNGTTVQTFTANQSTNATANIATDEWFATSAQIQSDNTVTFTGVDDSNNNGYDLYCNNKLISVTALSVTGNGTSSATLVYTTSGGAQGDVCYLRIIK